MKAHFILHLHLHLQPLLYVSTKKQDCGIEEIPDKKISLGHDSIDATAASGRYFIWKAPHCESSLLLVAHSTSLSPARSCNYCMVKSFPEAIISCTVSLLLCSCSTAEQQSYCEHIDIRHFHNGNSPDGLCHRRTKNEKMDIKENCGTKLIGHSLTHQRIDLSCSHCEKEAESLILYMGLI